jgi:hypothetical protein
VGWPSGGVLSCLGVDILKSKTEPEPEQTELSVYSSFFEFEFGFDFYMCYISGYGFHYRNRVLCRVLDALPSAFCRALGKVLLSVMTAFKQNSQHRNTLGKKIFAECQTLGEWQRSAKSRQQPSVSDGRYLCRAPSFGTRQRRV